MIHFKKKISASTTPNLVIHVLTSLDFGGVERHMEIIASALKYAKMRHLFVAIGGGGATELKLRKMGAEVICLGENPSIPNIGAFIAIFRLLSRKKPLAVHTHGAEANFHGLLAAWLARVPVRIGEEIGIPNHGSIAKVIFRLVYCSAHRVIGISKAVTEWLITSHEVPQKKAVQLYNPVQLPDFSLDEKTPQVFRIGFVGRLEPVKNPLALLEAFITILSDGYPCELWLIGDGSQHNVLAQRISEMGIGDNVKLLGFQADPSQWVRQCHVYVQPSLSEGFGLALVEAMGCGVPVISTSVGGAPEIIEHGVTGWLLSEATSDQISIALRVARTFGEQKLIEMGQQSRKSVEYRFEPVKYLYQIENLYSNNV